MDLSRRKWLLTTAGICLSLRRQAVAKEPDVYGRYTHLLSASTNQRTGAPFRLSSAVLRLGLKERYRGRVIFRSSDPKAVLPPPYEFSSRDDAYESHLFEVTLNSEGEHTVTIRDEKSEAEFTSNVVLAARREPKYKLYFGDIHIHSRWSPDGRGEPDYNYIYARDALNLDFACLTEHDPTDEIWEMVKAKARELYQPGKFATMSAFEWTGHRMNEGHKNVYYRDWEGPIFRSNAWKDRSPNTTSAADLWAQLRKHGQPAVTIPHHPASKMFPVPWDHYDPEFQRAVEVYSAWGSCEYPGSPRLLRPHGGTAPGHFVQDALAAGQRLGFVAASDSHSGRPGYVAHGRRYFDSDYVDWANEKEIDGDAYTGGVTGIYTEELTREAVFDAIHARRCYATTGVRSIMDFRADDHWMGEEYKSRHAPHFKVKVIGTAPLQSVTLVKNNQDYAVKPGRGRKLEFEYGKTEPPRETDCYYLRVIQEDGEMAWSSPVWITRK